MALLKVIALFAAVKLASDALVLLADKFVAMFAYSVAVIGINALSAAAL